MSIAFVFPGQGSQSVGMYSAVLNKKEFVYYFDIIERVLGKNFIEKIQNGSQEELKDTKISQPAIFSLSCMLSDYLMNNGIIPNCVAGHSLGEYSAFYSAKVFDFETGLKLIKKRAEVMSEVGEKQDGGMWAIIGGDLKEIESSLFEFQEGAKSLWIANYNSPGQIVLSGNKEVFDIWYSKMHEKVKKIVPLAVSGPFHSPLMKEAETLFSDYLKEIELNDPKLKIVSSTTGEIIKDKEEAKNILLKQFTNSVKWVSTISFMIKNIGVNCFIEVGPGKVLQGLIKRIDSEVNVLGFEKPEDLSIIKGEVGC